MKIKCSLILGAFLALSACQNQAEKSSDYLVEEGQKLVAENCLSCHVLSSGSESPYEGAPALSSVLTDINKTSLADDFREGIHVGHADMPDFDFGPEGTDAVLAYLKSIQTP